MIRLAVDPGDRHVGWALQSSDGVVTAGEWTPADSLRRVETFCRGVGRRELVIEEFVLYPNKAKHQAGSQMLTSQLIGAMRLIAGRAGVPVVMQGATIKKPTRRQLQARGIRLVGEGVHANDAELHLWHSILKKERR